MKDQLEILTQLRKAEPANPRWPAKAAVLHLKNKRPEEAIRCCAAAANLGDMSLALNEVWGRSLHLAGDRRAAIAKLETCRRRGSRRRGVWIALGMSYLAALQNGELVGNEVGKAKQVWDQIRTFATSPDLLSNAAAFALQTQTPEDAIFDCERALEIVPTHAPSWFNLGAARNQTGDFAGAIQAHQKGLLAAQAESNAQHEFVHMHQTSLGANYSLLEDFESAHRLFDQVLQDAPNDAECHHLKGCTYLKEGEFQKGWKHFEWRPKSRRPDDVTLESWDGSKAIRGKRILVRAEQGLGDTFQFCRFIALLESKGAAAIFDCQPQIRELLRRFSPFTIASNSHEKIRPADYSVDLLSIPYLLGASAIEIPFPDGYLNHSFGKNPHWKDRLARKEGETLVGISWRGNPLYSMDNFRSTTLEEFSPLLAVDSIRFISLQQPSPLIEEEIASFPRIQEFNDLDFSESFVDTAEIMPQLDLVICTDSAIAHLAGALGCRVWLALPRYAEWRWQCQRMDSPWYSRMRLYRQHNFKQWRPVFETMARDLRAQVEEEQS